MVSKFIFGNFGYRPFKSLRYMCIGFATIPEGVNRASSHLLREAVDSGTDRRKIIMITSLLSKALCI